MKSEFEYRDLANTKFSHFIPSEPHEIAWDSQHYLFSGAKDGWIQDSWTEKVFGFSLHHKPSLCKSSFCEVICIPFPLAESNPREIPSEVSTSQGYLSTTFPAASLRKLAFKSLIFHFRKTGSIKNSFESEWSLPFSVLSKYEHFLYTS